MIKVIEITEHIVYEVDKDNKNAPINIVPRGGGHTRDFRQKTIPDRRELYTPVFMFKHVYVLSNVKSKTDYRHGNINNPSTTHHGP